VNKKICAGYLLRDAVRRKIVIKPEKCNYCLREFKFKKDIGAHHPNYLFPLAVEWVCRQCHSNLHNKTYKNPQQDAKSKKWYF
jgi:hypothetical protein